MSPALENPAAALLPPEPVAVSPAMREVLEAARDVAPTPTTALLLGESGTGKELLARFLHQHSQRPGAFVAVNCAALPAELLESELFGHERGAFTGAAERRAGRFEQAQRGTLLLDEVSELPLPLQAKLLRVLQEREVDRVGGQRPIPVDVRIIATSNRDLGQMVERGLFRADLYYRLNVFPIVLPPLRERREDLPALAEALVLDAAAALGRRPPALDLAALAALLTHPFPGNVRELRNLLERALVRCRGPVIGPAHLHLHRAGPVADLPAIAPGAEAPALPLHLGELERLAIGEALRRAGGNRTHAARLLGIGLRTLRNRLRTYREAGVALESADPAARHLWPVVLPAPPHLAHAGERALARSSQKEGA
ncbi:MAG TPA: sigma-54 dependent transcriptional regulator [Anaeromyxobacteraceae bacterium]|nr:sigma-54 dependent transcriptional regulator [Anaeromyxobacteraceae bacterium]